MAYLGMEPPYPDLWWRFLSEHYVLWGSHSGHYLFVPWCIMGNDIARDVHCDILKGYDVAMGSCRDVTMDTGVVRILIYFVLLCPIMIFLFS